MARGLSRADISDDILSRWRELEARSLEGNAYLSPHFVMPAARHLNPDADLVFVLVSRSGDSGDELCGLGVFERRHGDRHFPLPYWRAYKSRHSFLTGILVDARFPEAVLDACFAFLKQERLAIDFPECLAEGKLADHLRQAAARGGWLWESRYEINRAFMVPDRCGDSYIDATVSPKSRKRLRSQANRLAQQGEMSWQLSRGEDPDCVERLLELEHMGWKGEEGTSLRAGSGDEAFFRAMVAGFSGERRIFFTELRVGGEVIASTVNLISGKRGFAFKMGWNPAFAPFSPSILNVLELTRQAGTELAELELVDSGAGEGSFVDKLWEGRYTVAAGAFRHASLPGPVLGGIRFLRQLRDRLR
ncbi:GNAT family N-acetyltransferase [Methyloterricola oryzae]|uniref:GNAT family N-acetyltransferase n=1 Tax=Methyloterricola oryzae TaxID=1495050 RepID=UPI0013016870|nr:GNAT family N-acetyltransferase [Methyloterricola oryzae]